MMGLTGKVTAQDRRIWQIQAHVALGELLEEAHKKRLEPIAWHVADGLQVQGRIDSPLLGAAERRALFDQWAAFLFAKQVTETPSGFDLRLVARDGPPLRNRVTVTLVCDIPLTPGDEPPDA